MHTHVHTKTRTETTTNDYCPYADEPGQFLAVQLQMSEDHFGICRTVDSGNGSPWVRTEFEHTEKIGPKNCKKSELTSFTKGDGCITVEWLERTAEQDLERLEFTTVLRPRRWVLNTQEVRMIGLHMDRQGIEPATAQPAEWKAHSAHSACCTQCGEIGKKRWFTRQDGVNLQKLCPTCMSYHRNNVQRSEEHISNSAVCVFRLSKETESQILSECTH